MVKKTVETTELVETIIDGIKEKKGNEILKLDLRHLTHAVCKYFVICDAESTTQTQAIAQSVEEKVENEISESVWRKSGYENSQWILLDYADVVVHIFLQPYRNFYDLEGLWADAKIAKIDSDN